MAASVLGYFGINNAHAVPSKDKPESKQTPIRALPAPWYTTQEMYELERRAIFSRKWLFITHHSRLKSAGDFLRYTIAGFNILITRDRSGNINAFHNVCRHRAYPVVERDEGNAKILSCRYHGWSYGIDGKFAKAPDYNVLDGFEKEKNGLLRIHTHIDVNGFIFINLDSKSPPEMPWEADFADVDKQERFSQFRFDDYELDHTYELEGEYNWKILADNFNECYHCKTTHPDVPTFLTIDSHNVDVKDGHMQHDQAATPEQRAKGFHVCSTYYFPNVSMSISPHFMMIQKFLPTGPSTSKMHYEIYRNTTSSEEDFKLIADIYARVMSEDKVLCEGVQKNLNAGVIVNGELHPRWEKGPLFFQNTVRQTITGHFKREKATGHQIWPARQQLPPDAVMSEGDLEICRGLACGPGKEGLVW